MQLALLGIVSLVVASEPSHKISVYPSEDSLLVVVTKGTGDRFPGAMVYLYNPCCCPIQKPKETDEHGEAVFYGLHPDFHPVVMVCAKADRFLAKGVVLQWKKRLYVERDLQLFPSAPPPQQAPTAGTGKITVSVPADAVVSINGHQTNATGNHRNYVSVQLKAGRVYPYEVRAQVVRDGKVFEETQSILLRPGERKSLVFDFTENQSVSLASAIGR